MDAVEDARDLRVGRLLVELAALDELLDLPVVTLRASASPASTSSSSTSFSTTGMPAAAIVWAIWPPMVPAPTTAALKTNMF